MNIGVLRAGTAPNVIAGQAHAEVLFRTGLLVERLLSQIQQLSTGLTLEVPYRSDPIRFRVPKGHRGQIVSFACDLPLLTEWGEPLLVGPGSIRDAHAPDEKVDLSEIEQAVLVYVGAARELLSRGEEYLEGRSSDRPIFRSPDSSSFTSRSHPRA